MNEAHSKTGKSHETVQCSSPGIDLPKLFLRDVYTTKTSRDGYTAKSLAIYPSA